MKGKGSRAFGARVVLLAGTAWALAWAVPGPADAELFSSGGAAPVEVSPAVSELRLEPGATAWLPLVLEFPPTHHLNAEPAPRLDIAEPAGLKVAGGRLEGDSHYDEFLEVDVYTGRVRALFEILADSTLNGTYVLKGKVTYYVCSDADLSCFEQSDPIQVAVRIGPSMDGSSPSVGGGL